MELIFSLILTLLGYLPAIIITIVVFFINPIMGILIGLMFLSVVVITSIVQIRKIIKNKRQ